MVAGTKIDDSFPKGQFYTDGYADPLRLDVNGEVGDLFVYVKSDITMKQLKSFKFEFDIKCICFETNSGRSKWALSMFTNQCFNQKISFSKILAKQLIITIKTMTNSCTLGILIQ